MRCLVLAGALTALAIAPVSAQDAAKKPWTAPRTPDGHPDLQGIWTNATITPIERPDFFKDKPTLTEKEAHAYETRVSTQFNTDSRGPTPEQDRDQAYNRLFLDRGDNLFGHRSMDALSARGTWIAAHGSSSPQRERRPISALPRGDDTASFDTDDLAELATALAIDREGDGGGAEEAHPRILRHPRLTNRRQPVVKDRNS